MVSSSASAAMTPEQLTAAILELQSSVAEIQSYLTALQSQQQQPVSQVFCTGCLVTDDDVFVPGCASICPSSHPAAMDAAPAIDFVLCSSIDDGADAHDGKHLGGHDDGRSSTLHWRCCPPRCTNHPAPIHRWDLL